MANTTNNDGFITPLTSLFAPVLPLVFDDSLTYYEQQAKIVEKLNQVIDFTKINSIKYADPIKWDITSQYEANTVVTDTNGNAYLSVKPVPAGISINRAEYWTKIGNFDAIWTNVKSAITPYDEGADNTATRAYKVNDLVWVQGVLRIVTKAMVAGDRFTSGNSEVTSINAQLDDIRTRLGDISTTINDEITNRVNGDSALQTAINKEVTDRKNADNGISTSLDNMRTEFLNKIENEQTARTNADNKLQNEIDGITNHLKSGLIYVNALDAGIKKGTDVQYAVQNATVLQQLLDEGKTVFFPIGTYVMGNTITISRPCGIIGENVRGTSLQWTTSSGNGITYKLQYNAQYMHDKIYFTTMVSNLSLYGTTGTSGAGIYIQNYTFEVEAAGNVSEYAKIKGDAYALECRNTLFENLIVSGWRTGIDSSLEVAYVRLNNIFIDTCSEYGIHAGFSDSFISDIVVTFCYHGIQAFSEANKWVNIACKMGGRRYAYDSSHSINGSIGVDLYGEWSDEWTNLEVQEWGARGVIVENNSHDIVFNGCIVDANGFLATNDNNVGMEIFNSHRIFGTVMARNKNTKKTQRAGLYVDNLSSDVHLQYSEENQIESAYSFGYHTQNAIIPTTSRSILVKRTNMVQAPYFLAKFDGYNIYINGDFRFTTALNVGDTFDLSELFINFPIEYSGWYNKVITVRVDNFTDRTTTYFNLKNLKTLECVASIPAEKQCHINTTIPVFIP